MRAGFSFFCGECRSLFLLARRENDGQRTRAKKDKKRKDIIWKEEKKQKKTS